jgi:lysophospholipase L1-like esterase
VSSETANAPPNAPPPADKRAPRDGRFASDLSTRWSSNRPYDGSARSWQVDLSRPQPLGSVRISWERAYAQSYSLESSADGSAWVSFFNTTKGKGGVETHDQLNAHGRWLRIVCTERFSGSQWGFSFYELEAFTSKTAPPLWGAGHKSMQRSLKSDDVHQYSTQAALTALALLLPPVFGHGRPLPINRALGVPGFPDCRRPAGLGDPVSVSTAAMELQCFQRGSASMIKIGCVGDSITAGVHSSNRGTMAYPAQLQRMIDTEHGKGRYAVTNLGACGSTVLKKTPNKGQPYWERPQYKTLIANKWDVIVIMLGTNDANPNAWPISRGCGSVATPTTDNCQYADDFVAMIAAVRKLGTNSSGPRICECCSRVHSFALLSNAYC